PARLVGAPRPLVRPSRHGHRPGFSGTYDMIEQYAWFIHHALDGIALVGKGREVFRKSWQLAVRTVVVGCDVGIEFLVVGIDKTLIAVRVFGDPLGEVID